MTAIVNELLSGYVGSEPEIAAIKKRLDELERKVEQLEKKK